MDENNANLDQDFRDKLKYVDKNKIRLSGNLEVKNSLIRILMSFMLFESEFFESPVYEPEDDSVIWDSVSGRLTRIQKFFNDVDYRLVELKWFIDFQNYFYDLYLTNDSGRRRFEEIAFNSETNLEGLKKENMRNLYQFLDCAPHNERSFRRYFEKNEKYAIKNALKLCYVFRNNICHGKKGLDDLVDGTYRKDFDVISDFLIELMIFLKKENGNKKF